MLTIDPPTSTSTTDSPTSRRPKWVPNQQTSSCTSCQHQFTLFFRRHHCRACGQIFCNACSQHQSTIPELGYFQPTRVCKMCVQRCSSHDTPPHSTRKPKFPRSPALPASSRGGRRSFGRMIENNTGEYSPMMQHTKKLSFAPSPMSAAKATSTTSVTTKSKLLQSSSSTPTTTTKETTVRLWLPDITSDACHQCQATFNASGRRKHHCRSCARVFCNSCTLHTVSSTRLTTISKFQNSYEKEKQHHQRNESMERVCRRCYSRLMSTDSTFGRHAFTTKQMLVIVQFSDVLSIGRLYQLNVKWHGVLSSKRADQMIWYHLCFLCNPKNGLALKKVPRESTLQPWRNQYLCTVAMPQNIKIATLMLKENNSIGLEAAKLLMKKSTSLQSIKSTSSISSITSTTSTSTTSITPKSDKSMKSPTTFYTAIPALVAAAASSCLSPSGTNASSLTNMEVSELLLKKACHAAGALLNCTRTDIVSCRNLIQCKGVEQLLCIVRDLPLRTKLHKNIVIHSIGTIWNVFRSNQYVIHTTTTAQIKTKTLECIDSSAQVFGTILNNVTANTKIDSQRLQIMTNCSGALAYCCKHSTNIEIIASALSSLIRSVQHVFQITNSDNKEKEAKEKVTNSKELSRYYRAACTTLRNAVVQNEAAQTALQNTGGLQIMMQLLEWKGEDVRVAKCAAAVMINATDTFVLLRKNIISSTHQHWCTVMHHIGNGLPELQESWEYCAGVICNCTTGGVALDSITALLLKDVLNKIQMFEEKENGLKYKNILNHLCGAVCNLSLIRSNDIYFEEYNGIEILKTVAMDIGYAKQALQHLRV